MFRIGRSLNQLAYFEKKSVLIYASVVGEKKKVF